MIYASLRQGNFFTPGRVSLVLVCCLVCAMRGRTTLAAGTIVSTGFENPYVLGPLQGQFGWVTAGNGGSTAVVENSVFNSGSQAVTVTKAAAADTDRRWALPQSGYPSQRYILIDWDMRVAPTSNPLAFGPFFGVEAYDADIAPYLLGSLGVDASTGDVLYQGQDSGVLTETGSKATFNQWYHYRLVLDFATDTYRGFFNGAQVASTGFVDRAFGLDNFTDADIATFAAAADATSQSVSSSAVFDNFVVRDGLLGDYDIDGDVDSADYTRWRQTFGNSISPPGSNVDGSHNGVADAADYVLWRHNLGASVASGFGAATNIAIPEPTGCIAVLMPLVLFVLGLRRMR